MCSTSPLTRPRRFFPRKLGRHLRPARRGTGRKRLSVAEVARQPSKPARTQGRERQLTRAGGRPRPRVGARSSCSCSAPLGATTSSGAPRHACVEAASEPGWGGLAAAAGSHVAPGPRVVDRDDTGRSRAPRSTAFERPSTRRPTRCLLQATRQMGAGASAREPRDAANVGKPAGPSSAHVAVANGGAARAQLGRGTLPLFPAARSSAR